MDECKFPSDFIFVAEMFAILGNNDRAMKFYEGASETSFDLLEFAQITRSIFLKTKNLKKAFEFFDQDISSAKITVNFTFD